MRLLIPGPLLARLLSLAAAVGDLALVAAFVALFTRGLTLRPAAGQAG